MGNIEWFCEKSDLPLLQNTLEANWWLEWEVTYRDVVILDRNGEREAVFNLTEHDLWDAEDYDALKTLLLDIAQDSD